MKGKVKEAIGQLFGNLRLEIEGKDEKLDGRVQETTTPILGSAQSYSGLSDSHQNEKNRLIL